MEREIDVEKIGDSIISKFVDEVSTNKLNAEDVVELAERLVTYLDATIKQIKEEEYVNHN